jgi:hypothetical protein
MTVTVAVLSKGALDDAARARDALAEFATRRLVARVLSAVIGNPGIIAIMPLEQGIVP